MKNIFVIHIIMNRTFLPNDLLTFEELKQIVFSADTNERSAIIAKKLIKYCFICERKLFILDVAKVVYRELDLHGHTDVLESFITGFINTSMNAILEEERVALSDDAGKNTMNYLRGNGFLKNNKSQITSDLKLFGTLSELFGPELKKIHFENGYLDLSTLEFKQRELGVDIIRHSVVIQRKYEPANDFHKEDLLKSIRKIYPKNDEFEYMLYKFGSALILSL